MAIYDPQIELSPRDKALIQLLDKLIREELMREEASTNSLDLVTLSDSDALKLSLELDSLLTRIEFIGASALAEAVSRGEFGEAREYYLSSRRRKGKTRVMATRQYAEFLARLGFPYQSRLGVAYSEMSMEHFIRMERKLLQSLGISPIVVDLAMRYVDHKLPQLNDFREGNLLLSEGYFRALVAKVKHGTNFPGHALADAFTKHQLAGLLITFSNVTALGVTRDWSVAGTLSTIAGGLTMADGA